jgi:integrase/recombinase XerD
MDKTQTNKFNSLYKQHISALQRQGKADTTIDVYSLQYAVSLSLRPVPR